MKKWFMYLGCVALWILAYRLVDILLVLIPFLQLSVAYPITARVVVFPLMTSAIPFYALGMMFFALARRAGLLDRQQRAKIVVAIALLELFYLCLIGLPWYGRQSLIFFFGLASSASPQTVFFMPSLWHALILGTLLMSRRDRPIRARWFFSILLIPAFIRVLEIGFEFADMWVIVYQAGGLLLIWGGLKWFKQNPFEARDEKAGS